MKEVGDPEGQMMVSGIEAAIVGCHAYSMCRPLVGARGECFEGDPSPPGISKPGSQAHSVSLVAQ